jgi:cytidylate kinase
MKDKIIITIGRQFGSGGRVIGKAVAEKLGISFYDKEIITVAAKESGMCEQIFETHDEKPTSSFLYSLVMDTYSLGYGGTNYMEVPIGQKVFLAQFDAIKKIADRESCVIVGRCADYALEDHENVFNVFIHAEKGDRIKRVMSRDHIAKEADAWDVINKSDKRRANYYNYYSNKKWGDAKTYDLCLNSSLYDIDTAANLIIEMADKAYHFQ